MHLLDDCIFCKISRGDIPAGKIYEDDDVVAFNDIHPKAPVHFLIIPKKHIQSLADAAPEDAALLGKMINLVPVLAKKAGCKNGDQHRPRRRSGSSSPAYSCLGRTSALG